MRAGYRLYEQQKAREKHSDMDGWARLLNWVAHPLGFGFSKGAVFDFVFSLLDTRAQRARKPAHASESQ
jgi:hypothetical protein